jgi:hypothetical protein
LEPVSLTIGGVVAALVLKAVDKTGERRAGTDLEMVDLPSAAPAGQRGA